MKFTIVAMRASNIAEWLDESYDLRDAEKKFEKLKAVLKKGQSLLLVESESGRRLKEYECKGGR